MSRAYSYDPEQVYQRKLGRQALRDAPPLDKPTCVCGEPFTYDSDSLGRTVESCSRCGVVHTLQLRHPIARKA